MPLIPKEDGIEAGCRQALVQKGEVVSLYKAILHGKERRKPYTGSESVDVSCRNHGGGYAHPCRYCECNRLWHAYREKAEVDDQLQTLDEMLDEERRLRHGEPQDWERAVIDAYSQPGEFARAREDSRKEA